MKSEGRSETTTTAKEQAVPSHVWYIPPTGIISLKEKQKAAKFVLYPRLV